jgi:hypothetical protein
MLEEFDLDQIQDLEGARQAIVLLLNLVENIKLENQELREQVQRLRDEINRLKGEQGKPKIKPNKKRRTSSSDHSSEQERRKPKQWKKGSKKDQVKIDDVQVLEVDPEQLPEDARFKGYVDVVVQDIEIRTNNILFRKEKYHSPFEGKTYLAELPRGYEGEFGPGIKALAIVLHFGSNMTEPKILEFFHNAGVRISSGQLSNFLIKNQAGFHAEKDAVYEAGLRSSPWQHIDDTAMRVNGQNQYCHIVCNPLYTAYFTLEKKNRLTVVDVLRNVDERIFRLNEESFALLDIFKLPAKVIRQLQRFPQDQELSEARFTGLLEEHLPDLGPRQHDRVLDAAAVAAYHAQLEFPIVRLVICDDAPQFKLVTEELALCWVHDGRHYKKLNPCVAYHRQLLDTFLERYWAFYDQLLTYCEHPTSEEYIRLEKEFDKLFSTVTGYDALDERIAKTKAKKQFLLMALDHPEIPLHNNPAELGARKRVRQRDVSFGTRTEDGTKASDTFTTLAATAKKLYVSFYAYIHDRISSAYEMPSLADLITQKAEELQLGASWHPPP